MPKQKRTKFIAEVVLTIDKQHVLKKYVKGWLVETLLAKAKREGWDNLLSVRVRSIDLD